MRSSRSLFIVVGLGLASAVDDPTMKMLFLCVAGFGFFAVLPVFWTLPTAFLSGAGAAAGIAAVNSIGNLGGYFGPQVFGLLRDHTGNDVRRFDLPCRMRVRRHGDRALAWI